MTLSVVLILTIYRLATKLFDVLDCLHKEVSYFQHYDSTLLLCINFEHDDQV